MNTDGLRCWAEIDCDALRRNANIARQRVRPEVSLLAVIKANAYGHGLPEVATALSRQAELFGVANLDEAIAARAVVDHPIMILGPALPQERAAIAERGFIASVSSYEEATEFDRVAHREPMQLNLVVDTGMGRMGCAEGNTVSMLQQISQLHRAQVHSISTHLPVADEDSAFTAEELARFKKLVATCRAQCPGNYQAHALLSAGVLAFHEDAFDITRAGLMLYGISPLPEFQHLLSPALTLKTRVALLRTVPAGATISYGRTFTAPREMRVATLSAGYADGFPRAVSGRGAEVLLAGSRCAVLGRVTMDLIVIDVSKVARVQVGEEVVLIGRQGNEEILVTEIARRAGTIPWEILTGIGSRVRRVYLNQ